MTEPMVNGQDSTPGVDHSTVPNESPATDRDRGDRFGADAPDRLAPAPTGDGTGEAGDPTSGDDRPRRRRGSRGGRNRSRTGNGSDSGDADDADDAGPDDAASVDGAASGDAEDRKSVV